MSEKTIYLAFMAALAASIAWNLYLSWRLDRAESNLRFMTEAAHDLKLRAEQAEQRLAEIAGRTMDRHIERAAASRKGWQTRRAKKTLESDAHSA